MKANTFKSITLAAASLLILNGCSTMGGSKHTSGTASDDGVPGLAGQQSGMAASGKQQMSMSWMMDEMALNELHHINEKEIAMSQMAETKAESPEVKRQAAAILADHRALEAQVKAAADAQKVELMSYSPSTYEKATMARLGELSGGQFDQAFTRQMLLSHQMASQQLMLTRKHVTNPLVTKLINQTMPKIAQHTQMTRQQAGSVGGSISSPDQSQDMSDQGSTISE